MKANDIDNHVLPFTLYPLHLIFLLAVCLLPASLRADEFSKTSHYSVRMFSYGLLTIDARMGDIQIEGWDNPRLEIEAEKVVQAGSEAKAKPLYERVQVSLQGQDKKVLLRTVYPPRRLWRPFRGESKLSVNFHIRMPYDANLLLKCVDGDVRVQGLTGNQVIRVSYGDVEVNVPDVYGLRSLDARSLLGYVQSDLHGGENDSAGFMRTLSFRNSQGAQNIHIRVRMGGVFIYRQE
ncbi:MAG: cell wall-active antibiotics response protein [Acidobacteriia bacterium]|nr:cell wall-active antibiotics response protein [Terriglobia bacterium]